MNQPPQISFRVLSGLPADGAPAEQFTSGARRTHSEGLVLEIQTPNNPPWVGNFQLGLNRYCNVGIHPNGGDLVVIAGGVGYIVRPNDRKLVATFGGGIMGVWAVPKFNFLVFNDGGIAFRALGSEGWRWKTPRISWDGFEGIEIAEKTIYGRAWNAVSQCWQPFRIEIATGTVQGGAYSEDTQQGIARSRELTLRGGAPLHPLVKRVIEAALGVFAIALSALTIYLVVEAARAGELTWLKVRENWGLAYAGLFFTTAVLVFGVRLVFPALAPQRRLLSRSGIIAFAGVYLVTSVILFVQTGAIPIFPLVVIGSAVAIFAIRKWFS